MKSTWIGILLALTLVCGALAGTGAGQGPGVVTGSPAPQQDKEGRMHDLNDARVPPGAPSMHAMAAIMASGDYRIDALLSGYRWYSTTVTYSFYSDAVFHGAYYGTEVVSEVSAGIKTNVRQIMAWYGTLMNVNFVEVTETASTIGDIRFMLSNGPGYAYAYYPSGSGSGLAGDVHLNPSYDRLGDTNGFQHPPGQHGYVSLVHEVGHTLGLKHPFDASPTLPAAEDNQAHTVMTYTFTGSSPATPMGYDLLALQYIYAARPKNTGNDNYLFTSRGTDQYTLGATLVWDTPYRTQQAIWDSGGFNNADFSALPAVTGGYRLDLRELGWLTASSAYHESPTSVYMDQGSVIGPGVAIRDVTNSSSADTFYANAQPNVFRGYSRTRATGSDVIYEAAADDTLDLSGYTPSEVTDTQSGMDRVLGLGANGSVTIKNYYAGNALAVTFSPVMPSFSISDASVVEGNSGTVPMNFTVSLSSATTDTLEVSYSTSPGTATAGTDYVSASGTLTFNPNETSKTISVTVIGDTVVEPDETLFVNLTNATNLTNAGKVPGISDAQGIGTILNDDVNQKPVANASATPTSGQAPLLVQFTGSGTDPDGTIVSYSWNFGDGGTSTAQNPQHTYAKGGTYTAVLTVTDNGGATGTAQVVITVTDAPLTVPTMSPVNGIATRPSTVPITATVNTGSAAAAGATVVFTMTKPNRKTARYTATANSLGVAAWNYSVGRKDALGTYTVSAKATYNGQTAYSQAPHAYFKVQ